MSAAFQIAYPRHGIIYFLHSDSVSKACWLGGSRQLSSAENPTHQHLLNSCTVLELLGTQHNNNSNTSFDESYSFFRIYIFVIIFTLKKTVVSVFQMLSTGSYQLFESVSPHIFRFLFFVFSSFPLSSLHYSNFPEIFKV